MIKRLNAYKENKINLSNPDKVLKNIMEKYNFNATTPLIYERHKTLELKLKQSCFVGKCIEKVLPQKTIEGYYSDNITARTNGYAYDYDGNITKKPFIYKGVALLHNYLTYADDVKTYGGEFNLTNFNFVGGASSFDEMDIDALVIFDPYSFLQPKIKQEVEAVAK